MIKKFYYSHLFITYDSNGATSGNTPIDTSCPYRIGDSVIVLGNTGNLQKTDYTFTGWNTKSDGTGTHYDAYEAFIINDNVILYAEWLYTGSVVIKFPSGSSVIGCMYTGNPNYPKGQTVSVFGSPTFSIGLIINGNVTSPRRHNGPGGGGGSSQGSVQAGQSCTFAAYEGNLQTAQNIQLIGISISSIQNGALQQMQYPREYTMPVGSSSEDVDCSYYDFIAPNDNTPIELALIFEPIND